jgi:hypothetical protein
MLVELASQIWPVIRQIPGWYVSPLAVGSFSRNHPIGGFLSKNPASRFLQAGGDGFDVELNLYNYSLNDPLNWLDPYGYGKKGRGIGGAVGGFIGGALGWHLGGGFTPLGFGLGGAGAGLGYLGGGEAGDFIEDGLKGKYDPEPEWPDLSPMWGYGA